MRTIEVPLGTRSYPVLIGASALDRAGALLKNRIGGRAFIVTDANLVGAGWAERLARALDGIDLLGLYTLAPGEDRKTMAELAPLLDGMIEAGVERTDHVFALGGGMVGDVAGFAAAILKRGCGLVQLPTSLLAQVDSSVGGKTGINTPHGKNLIGAFHQPAAVLIDPDTLATLDARELRAGYAEIVKYGLIGDPDFFAWCEANGLAVLAGDAAGRARAIEASVKMKAQIVAQDERETGGRRALLNLGHTFAHALEAEAGFSGLRHGEAVAVGLALAFRLSALRGLAPIQDAERIERHLKAVGLPTTPAEADIAAPGERLVAHMLHDKKRQSGRLTLILARGIGQAFVDRNVEPEELADFLDGIGAAKSSPLTLRSR